MQYFKDKGVKFIAIGWMSFIGENVIVSHNRDYIINHLGEKRYIQIYSTCSTLAMASIAYGYFKYSRNKGPVLWNKLSNKFKYSAFIFQTIGLIGFSQSIPNMRTPINPKQNKGNSQLRCPFDIKAENPNEIKGFKRITRHEKLWSLGFLGLGYAFGTPFIGEIVLYSFPLIFAVIGGQHCDYRYRRNMGGYLSPEIDQKTCAIPFYAIITGNQSIFNVIKEIKDTNLIIAIFISILLQRRRMARLKKLNYI